VDLLSLGRRHAFSFIYFFQQFILNTFYPVVIKPWA